MSLSALERSRHPWAPRLAHILRTRLFICTWLPRRVAGFTHPLLPVVLIQRRNLERSWPAAPWLIVQLLLHECAHQCWAILPEWKNWLRLKNVYGPEHNAADAISEAIMRETFIHSAYPGRPISYRSPGERLRLWLARFRARRLR